MNSLKLFSFSLFWPTGHDRCWYKHLHPRNAENGSWDIRVCSLMSRKSKCLKRNLFTGARDRDQMLDDDFVSTLRYSVIGTCNKWTAASLIPSLAWICKSVCIRIDYFGINRSFNLFCDLIRFPVLCLTCWCDSSWQLNCSVHRLVIMTSVTYSFQCYFCLNSLIKGIKSELGLFFSG